jgi:hypothetical protein
VGGERHERPVSSRILHATLPIVIICRINQDVEAGEEKRTEGRVSGPEYLLEYRQHG